MDEVTIGGKTYISSKRAAEITGYAKDYVGQLCREGHVEARMVGRGWYVYEPSIRRHRFGIEEEKAPVLDDQVEEKQMPNWSAPVYKAEVPTYIPELEAPEAPLELESPLEEPELPPAHTETDTTLTDMQAAWREWFEKKREIEPIELESPEIVDARAEEDSNLLEHREEEPVYQAPEPVYEAPEAIGEPAEEVAIPLHRIEEQTPETVELAPEPEEENIPIQRIRMQREIAPEPEARIVREQVIRKGSRRTRTHSNAPIIAVLLAISLISVAIAVIGSGLAGNYIDTLVGKNAVTQYLVGERVVNK